MHSGSDDGADLDDNTSVVEVAIEDSIDLHHFRAKDIPDVVHDYLEAARNKGFTEVRLIHGKGIGVQRQRVQAILRTHPLVVRYCNAPPHRGGFGATLVWLSPLP